MSAIAKIFNEKEIEEAVWDQSEFETPRKAAQSLHEDKKNEVTLNHPKQLKVLPEQMTASLVIKCGSLTQSRQAI